MPEAGPKALLGVGTSGHDRFAQGGGRGSDLLSVARLHPLGGIVKANALKSLGREFKGRHYRA